MAISLFSLGAALGAMMGLALGGFVAENWGWRAAFLWAGLPGLLLALLVKVTLKEPPRGQTEDPQTLAAEKEQDEEQSFLETLKELFSNPVYRNVWAAHILVVFTSYSISSWLAEYLARVFPDISKTELGGLVGLVFFTGTVGGMFAGGFITTYFGKGRPAWQLRAPAYGLLISLPFYELAFTTQDNIYIALIFFCIAGFFFNMQHGPSLAIVQTAVKPSQRAVAASFNFFGSNMLGLALGSFIVGGISDFLALQFAELSLAFAIGFAILVSIPGMIIFFRTSKLLS